MKVSLNWIKEFVDLPADLSIQQLAYDLTMRTVEVEGFEDLGASLDKIVVAKIESVEPHPQADRLRVVKVDAGEDELCQVVCGGSNLEVGQMVVLAKPGSYVRWHGEGEPVEIKASKLRGVPSAGMICASAEIGMEELFPAKEEAEIVDLAGYDATPGQPVSKLVGRDDIIFEIDNKSITNRPDLWGHYGIARELAAIYDLPLKPLPEFKEQLPAGISVEIKDDSRCARYAALSIEGIVNKPSPIWMRERLASLDVRPINLMVDITNYVMLCVGEPTHAFDAMHVEGGIVVRRAETGEKLTLLNDEVVELCDSDLLIADKVKALALAGVMGGKLDSVLDDTQAVILEVANFDAIGTRRTATRLGVRTESSSRFEKALDTQRVDQALGMTVALLNELMPEARFTGFTDVIKKETQAMLVPVSKDYLEKRLGSTLEVDEVQALLGRLGFEMTFADGVFTCHVPSWRATGDVSLPADILEEVARIRGYESFEFKPPVVALEKALHQPRVNMSQAIARVLSERLGMQEIFTYPWVEDRYLEAAGIETEGLLKLATPPSPEQAHLRPSLVPGLIDAVQLNQHHFETFKIFEQGVVFYGLHDQRNYLAFALAGEDAEKLLLEAKGVLQGLPRLVQCEPFDFVSETVPGWAEPGLCLNLGNKAGVFGVMGALSVRAKRLAAIKRLNVVIVELNMDALVPLPSRDNVYQALPVYPLVAKDLSVILDDQVTWARVEALVRPMVRDLAYLTEFRGGNVPEGKRSLSFRVWLGSNEGTMTAVDIDKRMVAITRRLEKELGGTVPDGK